MCQLYFKLCGISRGTNGKLSIDKRRKYELCSVYEITLLCWWNGICSSLLPETLLRDFISLSLFRTFFVSLNYEFISFFYFPSLLRNTRECKCVIWYAACACIDRHFCSQRRHIKQVLGRNNYEYTEWQTMQKNSFHFFLFSSLLRNGECRTNESIQSNEIESFPCAR